MNDVVMCDRQRLLEFLHVTAHGWISSQTTICTLINGRSADCGQQLEATVQRFTGSVITDEVREPAVLQQVQQHIDRCARQGAGASPHCLSQRVNEACVRCPG